MSIMFRGGLFITWIGSTLKPNHHGQVKLVQIRDTHCRLSKGEEAFISDTHCRLSKGKEALISDTLCRSSNGKEALIYLIFLLFWFWLLVHTSHTLESDGKANVSGKNDATYVKNTTWRQKKML